MRFMCYNLTIILLTSTLVACGGRVARPVETVTSIDAMLTCDHLQAEFENNLKRFSELTNERKTQMRDNVGLIAAAPLFLDLKGTEKKESAALTARNIRLRELALAKSCPGNLSILSQSATQ
jgi:hypothetical protein